MTGKNIGKLLFDNRIEEDEWMSSEEAAQYLKLSIGSLRNLVSSGIITYYKLGARNRYRRSDLRDLLLRQKRGGLHDQEKS